MIILQPGNNYFSIRPELISSNVTVRIFQQLEKKEASCRALGKAIRRGDTRDARKRGWKDKGNGGMNE